VGRRGKKHTLENFIAERSLSNLIIIFITSFGTSTKKLERMKIQRKMRC
jgi:hypothetical protein